MTRELTQGGIHRKAWREFMLLLSYDLHNGP